MHRGMSSPVHLLAGARIAPELDIEALPLGHVTRLLIPIADDAIGREMRLPVVVVRGAQAGPVLGLTAALHGNELNGIPVIHRLVERVDPKQLKGSLVAVIVANLPAYFLHQRRFTDDADLNHTFPGVADGSESEVYAHRLVERVVSKFDLLIDLHTASFGHINSLYVRADMDDDVTATMARLQRPQIILHNPPYDHTLRGTADGLGIPAITLEIGNPQRFQAEFIRRSIAGVRAVMGEHGMLGGRRLGEVALPVICSRSYWSYTDSGGLLEVFPSVADHVVAGSVVGRLSNIFGDVVQEYKAHDDGIVIGKSTNPGARTGARILHLGIEETEAL